MRTRSVFSPAAMRAAREARELTREQLAVLIQRSYTAIVQYETIRTPPILVVLAIADALDVPIEALFETAVEVPA